MTAPEKKSHTILVTGAAGFVAGSVITQAPREWTLHLVSRRQIPRQQPNWTVHQADSADPEAISAVILQARPDAVIHTAAIANIDYCETHQDETLRINTEATRAVVDACVRTGAKLVFCSTDNVFDGRRGWYREEDAPNPVNYYGFTKHAAEKIIAAEPGLKAVIARIALVMGMPLLGSARPFMVRMFDDLATNGPVWAPPGEVRTPVDVISLGRALLELSENDYTGVIHLAGPDRIDRVDLVRALVYRVGGDPDRVQPVNAESIPNRALRPPDLSLDTSLARKILRTPLPGISEGFQLVMEAWERVKTGAEPEAYLPCGS